MLTRIVIIGDSQLESAFRTFGFASILNDRYNGEADITLRYSSSLASAFSLF